MIHYVRALATVLVVHASVIAAGTNPATAEIASVGGSVTIQTTPTTGTIAEGSIESTNISVWLENTQFLGSNLLVQHDGTAGTFSTFGQLTQGTLYAGTFVQSYMVQFDFPGSPATFQMIGSSGNATITFTGEITGVFAQSTGGAPSLNSSDGTFAPTTYNFSNARRFENTSDVFVISTDRRTLTINNAQVVNQNADQLRILINPEPTSAGLFGLGFIGFTVVRRWRRRRHSASRKSRARAPTALSAA